MPRRQAPAPAAPLQYPSERRKTVVAALWLLVCVWLRTESLALTHKRVPETNPLPDIILDNVQYEQWGLDASEKSIMFSTALVVAVVLLHKHRWIIIRRLFFLLGLLYFYKGITMFITVLPLSDATYPCVPKEETTTAYVIVKRIVKIISGFGLSINGQHVYCGDYIFSGHTMVLTMGYYAIRDYSPRKFHRLHYLSLLTSVAGVMFLLMARGHYSIDVVLAYWITSWHWRTWHSMANNEALWREGEHNLFSEHWWWFAFVYFEPKVPGPLPRQYNLPIPEVILNKLPENWRFEYSFE